MAARYLVIARDQDGAPRAWGLADTAQAAHQECQAQATAYTRDRPGVTLTLGSADRCLDQDEPITQASGTFGSAR